MQLKNKKHKLKKEVWLNIFEELTKIVTVLETSNGGLVIRFFVIQNHV